MRAFLFPIIASLIVHPLALASCEAEVKREAAVATQAPSAPAAPPPPPCIHETCSARLARQVCSNMLHSPSYGNNFVHTCAEWSFVYEHHCDCDRWATGQ